MPANDSEEIWYVPTPESVEHDRKRQRAQQQQQQQQQQQPAKGQQQQQAQGQQIMAMMAYISLSHIFCFGLNRFAHWILRHVPAVPENIWGDLLQGTQGTASDSNGSRQVTSSNSTSSLPQLTSDTTLSSSPQPTPIDTPSNSPQEQDPSSKSIVETHAVAKSTPLVSVLRSREYLQRSGIRGFTPKVRTIIEEQEQELEQAQDLAEQSKERTLNAAELIKYGEIQSRRLRPAAAPKPKTSNDEILSSVDKAITIPPFIEDLPVSEAGNKTIKSWQCRPEHDFQSLSRQRAARKLRWPVFPPLSQEWTDIVMATLEASDTDALVKTPEGVGLVRRDFATIVPPTQWLNDEIVNGALQWVDKVINWSAGINDVKLETRRCLAMNSFFITRLMAKGTGGTEALMRRMGVPREDFRYVQVILIPICNNNHWTLLYMSPMLKRIAHIDSLNPAGNPKYVELGKKWAKDLTKGEFDESCWSPATHATPAQINGHDCGMHVILNALCLSMGATPVLCYKSEQIPELRIRIAGMLLNSGFKGEFAIWE
ncbi:Ubiquitin-like-specific protease 1 [Escovopsis weberi]|uniref:Ubiquitin-like-specific protease 1 n=1 Tax=Escovopsis weberi TaxID=150374 RepID=A0A0M8N2Z6_ESCWE|nr:Ubiquitin-like-specific protease 1 [Escovopsis weberi]